MFKKKLIAALKFWKNDFLEIQNVDEDDPEAIPLGPDLYGPVWLIVLYTIVLGLAANLNDYFSLPAHNALFVFQTPYISSAVAINLVFRLAEVIIFPLVMGCLDGELSSREVTIDLLRPRICLDIQLFSTSSRPFFAFTPMELHTWFS